MISEIGKSANSFDLFYTNCIQICLITRIPLCQTALTLRNVDRTKKKKTLKKPSLIRVKANLPKKLWV